MITKLKTLWQKYNNKLWLAFRALKLPTFVIVIGFFGALSGSANSSSLFRRCGIPTLSTLYAYWVLSHIVGYINALWTISIMSMWGALALGYGISSEDYPENPNSDSGSAIGRFFTLNFRKLFKDNRLKAHRYANYLTRGTVGLTIGLSLVIIPTLTQQWITYFLGSLLIILVWAFNSWRGYGEIKFEFKGKPINLLYVDIVTYSTTGCGILAIIYRIFG